MKTNRRTQFILYIIGLVFLGFTSLVYTVSITRINGIEDAGRFAFAFAVACTFYSIGTYIGKTYQITDNSKMTNDSDYIVNKIISCGVMVLLTFLFSIINRYDINKIILILVLTLYRGTDAFVEVYHAIIQKKDNIAKVGLSVLIRTILLMSAFIITLFMKHDILFSSIVITILNVIYIISVDYVLSKKLIEKGKPSVIGGVKLALAGLPICVVAFLTLYVINSPKYAIDAFSNDTVQGIFNILVLPASFLSMVSLYISQFFLKDFSTFIKNEDYSKLTKKVMNISLMIFGFGLVVTIVSYFIGLPILSFMYSQDLSNMEINLVIILLGSIVYSIGSLFTNVYISLRKHLVQLFLIFLSYLSTIFIVPALVKNYGINGACYSYFVIMLIQLLLLLVGYFFIIHSLKKEKKVYVRLMGGLGNQMFQYAFVRNIALKNNMTAIIDKKGITGKSHNVFGLNHCNKSNEVIFVDNYRSLKSMITYLMYGLYCVFFENKKIGFKFYNMLLSIFSYYGIICIPDGYMKIEELNNNNNYCVGYFQSPLYSSEFSEIIKSELQINENLAGKNKKAYKKICSTESVCVHIRRGDYVGSDFDVCNKKYYYDGLSIIKKKKKNIVIFVFSDDIEWVKNNMLFTDEVIYVDWKNNQYQDLKLMSGCKNFVMSNSSFSYWAQFLSSNKNKIVVAPSKWYRTGKKFDIYDNNWILVDIDGEQE